MRLPTITRSTVVLNDVLNLVNSVKQINDAIDNSDPIKPLVE